MPMPPFHLAFPVTDLEATRSFYVEALGCGVGREDARWIDFDFFGHQITAHLVEGASAAATSAVATNAAATNAAATNAAATNAAATSAAATNEVDGDDVPVRHFGAVLAWGDWEALAARLRERGVPFLIEPRVRFAGQVGEQGTFFLRDPSGNALELKSFKDPARLFAR